MFVASCKDLIAATDHQPLTSVFRNWDLVHLVKMEAMADYGDDLGVIYRDLVHAADCVDPNYMTLVDTAERGFPDTRHMTNPSPHK